jgi:hypothetical protein
MSHPDPLFDPDNAMENDMNYDDHNDFWGLPENELDELRDQMNEDEGFDEEDEENDWDDSYDDSMDGDHESALASAGWGTDEDYGYFGEDLDYREDFHADDAIGYVDYNEDGPYDD